MEVNDANAIYILGCHYLSGERGLPQDYEKAMELWLRAGELGCVTSYCKIGFAYHEGRGVERDIEKAKHYFELGAMRGNVVARHTLGVLEKHAGNVSRAMKHWMISAGAGDDDSLSEVRECFMEGNATKDDFEMALRAHKEAKDEMKSEQREAAALNC